MAGMNVDRDEGQMTNHGETLRIVFRLSPRPDRDWEALFGGTKGGSPGGGSPEGYEHPTSMPHPELRGDVLAIEVPSGQVAEYVGKLDERIATTNDLYERDVTPRREQEKRALEEQHAERRRKREADQRALDELNKRRKPAQ
jgi:hypothetical protein